MYIRKATSDNMHDRYKSNDLEVINMSLRSDVQELESQIGIEKKRNKTIIILIGVLVLVVQVTSILTGLIRADGG